MYGWLMLFNLAVLCTAHTLRFESERPKFDILSDEEINYVNSLKTTWTAGRNFHPSQAKGVLRRLGAYRETTESMGLPVKRASIGVDLPDSYDPRDAYPQCKSLTEIRDQGDCGSCWAFGAVESMTDRICIASRGVHTPHISAEDLVSCCDSCGDGCEGGYPSMAWSYWVYSGIVTGGQYGSNQGCQPYSLQPCDQDVYGEGVPCPGPFAPTPQCQTVCRDGYNLTYSQDKRMGSQSYAIYGVTSMMQDLYQHGPIEVTFQVYTDFLSYKSGVYQHVNGDFVGGHAVKMMGWGTENGTPYWLVANSWNTDWGDNGYFKILRGQDECGIEDMAVAGYPG